MKKHIGFSPLEIEDWHEKESDCQTDDNDRHSSKTSTTSSDIISCSITHSALRVPCPDSPPSALIIEEFKDDPHEYGKRYICNYNQQVQHDVHTTWPIVFVVLMISSSAVAFMFQMYFIHLILDMTMRMYFCFPVIFFQTIEQIFVFIVIRRFFYSISFVEYQKPNGEYSPIIHEIDSSPVTQTFYQLSPFNLHKADNSINWWNVIRLGFELIAFAFFSICYVYIVPRLTSIISGIFEDIDGEVSSDWYTENQDMKHLALISKSVGFLYLLVISFALTALIISKKQFGFKMLQGKDYSNNVISTDERRELQSMNNLSMKSRSRMLFIIKICHIGAATLCIITVIILLMSISSAWTFLVDHNHNVQEGSFGEPYCDPMDSTECLLPFPSSFYTVEDNSTITGKRVNIEIDALRTMYRGYKNPKHPTKLNRFDGFSTSGPILFYLDGLKEGLGKGPKRLIGPDEIELSITNQSMTLLFDIDAKTLIHHFAEIDHLDESKPSVVVQPSKSLESNRRYAVALIDATDENGIFLKMSNHLNFLLNEDKDLSTKEKLRGTFYKTIVFPSMYEAAPYLDSTQNIQMIFDFQTMSTENQIGTTKKIIQATLSNLDSKDWDWNESNVRSISLIEEDCSLDGAVTGRVIHGSIDLPHYLLESNTRLSELDLQALGSKKPNGLFTVKFLVTIPCSIATGSKPLAAIVDFGHGFLHSRIAIIDRGRNYFQRMSHDQGYILVASNWRGMSIFDIPVIVKAFAADPNIIMNIRDGIIQGYAFKAGITHFCKHSLLEMDFMKFHNNPIKLRSGEKPRIIFYGISQGGILGSAYSTLMSQSTLLDGAAIVSAGTPFAAIMTRSSIFFDKYQNLMLLNLIHNRHVRIFISILQMVYDCVEAGGVLALTKMEDRVPTLLQAGIGDSIVTTIATRILARSYGASIFPSNPTKIFELPMFALDDHIEVKSVYTEFLYEEEARSLPPSDTDGGFNPVHICARSDPYAIEQLTEFINSGKFLDVCPDKGCRRKSSWQRWNKDYCV